MRLSPEESSPEATASSRRSPLYKWLLILFILAVAAFSAIPNYVTDRWPWKTPPELPHLESLKALQQQGLSLPNWHGKQQVIEIGGHKWSYQPMSTIGTTTGTTAGTSDSPTSPSTAAETNESQNQNFVLLLRPQTWQRDLPQVDWMDINGAQGWTEDSQRRLRFTLSTEAASPVQISARFFRGWNQERTFAVLQWYAWDTGGSPAPSDWFWVDQGSQWHDRQRTPWVAVCLFFPIKPLGDIETVRSQATALGQVVQSALLKTALSPTPT